MISLSYSREDITPTNYVETASIDLDISRLIDCIITITEVFAVWFVSHGLWKIYM